MVQILLAIFFRGVIAFAAEDACVSFNSDFPESASSLVKDCTLGNYSEKCFPVDRDHKKPFRLLNAKSDHVAICVHGLSDSPYYLKDVAQCIGEEGFEVWGIRLRGHVDEDQPQRIAEGSWESWSGAVRCAVERVLKQGRKPVLCGFSTGGALALSHTFAMEPLQRASGLLLFSPAVRLPWLAETLPLGWFNFPVSSGELRYCGRYHQLYSKGVHYLKQGLAELASNAQSKAAQQQLPIPLFVYLSSDDSAIRPQAAISFSEKYFREKSYLVIGKYDLGREIESSIVRGGGRRVRLSSPLDHSALLKTQGCGQPYEVNGHFDLLCSSVKNFVRTLKENSSANIKSAER